VSRLTTRHYLWGLTNKLRKKDRRSPLGLLIRHCFLSYSKLNFDGVLALAKTLLDWLSGSFVPSTSTFSTVTLDTPRVSQAKARLRRFFDRKGLDSSSRRIQHQYALLSLAELHFRHGEWQLARLALKEAFQAARSASDLDCLSACSRSVDFLQVPSSSRSFMLNQVGYLLSLQRRLEYYAPTPAPLLPLDDPDLSVAGYTRASSSKTPPAHAHTDGQPSETHHQDRKEILFSIRQRLSRGDPMRDLFQILYRCEVKAKGGDSAEETDEKNSTTVSASINEDEDEVDRLVVASELWNLLEGPDGTLVSLYGDLALDSARKGDQDRMTALAAKASRVRTTFCFCLAFESKNPFL
jgi:hypothetical protein